jgi:hypothetical protein
MDGCEAFDANVVAGQGSDDAQSIRGQGLRWIVVVCHDDNVVFSVWEKRGGILEQCLFTAEIL